MKFLRRKSRSSINSSSKNKEDHHKLVEEHEEEEDVSATMSSMGSSVVSNNSSVVEEEEEDPWSAENFAAMSAQWQLTPEDEIKMKELQTRLGDVDHWKNDPYEVVRFYKELKGNLKASEEKFRKMVFWRLENNIDSVLETYGEPDPLFDYFPSVILKGVDKENDPIFLERTGAFDAYGFYQQFHTKGMVDYVTYRRERDITRRQDGKGWQREYYEPSYGKRVSRYTVLMDVAGLNRGHMRAGLLPLLHQLARITQDNYAGVAKRIIILRAPSIFKLFWSLTKHFFDPAIRELVTFTTAADYLEVCDQYIDREVLPPQLCPEFGRGTVMPGMEHVHLDGAQVTPELLAQCRNVNAKKLSSTTTSSTTDGSETDITMTDYGGSQSQSLMDDFSSIDFSVRQGTGGVRVVSGVIGRGSFTLDNGMVCLAASN